MNIISLLEKHKVDPTLIFTNRKLCFVDNQVKPINELTNVNIKLIVINKNGIFDIKHNSCEKLSPRLFELCYPWTFYANITEIYGLNQEIDEYIENNSIDLIVKSTRYNYNFVFLRRKYKKKQIIINFENEVIINKCMFLSKDFQTIHFTYYNKFILSNGNKYFEYYWGSDKVKCNKECELITSLLDKEDCRTTLYPRIDSTESKKYVILEFD